MLNKFLEESFQTQSELCPFFLISAEVVWYLSVFLCAFADLKEMCELLGIEQSVLERAFSYRTVEAKLEKVSTTLNVAQVREKVPNPSCTSCTNV